MASRSAPEVLDFYAPGRFDTATKQRVAAFLDQYLATRERLAELDLGSTANALVLPAGGRK